MHSTEFFIGLLGVRASLFALSLAIAACGGAGDTDDPNASVPNDPRGWATDQPGLFGHRRGSEGSEAGGIGAIGYAPGQEPTPAQTGVLVHDPARTAPGVNLMCSGDRAAAVLMRADGSIAHQWAYPYGTLPKAPRIEGPHQLPWRRVALTDDGGLLAIHSGRALVSLDEHSALRWVSFTRAHHDLVLRGDGERIYVLSRTERVVPAVNPKAAIIDDLVLTFDRDGNELASLSVWEAFERSEFAPMLEHLTVREGDVMHTNSLHRLSATEANSLGLDGVVAGQFLICMRDLDMVAVLDVDEGRLVWMTQGPASGAPWRAPHDPTVTPDGTLLIFDNRGGLGETSRLLEFEPKTGALRWSWPDRAAAAAPAFESFFCGTAQRLSNGNVLTAESTQGRALEIDRATGEIVWEYVSDRLAGENDEFVAALFAIERM